MLGYFYVFKIASMGTIFRMRNNLLSWTSSMNLGPSVARKLTNNQGIQEYLLSYCVFCQRWSHFEAKIVADGIMPDTPTSSFYSHVVSLRGLCMCLFLAELKNNVGIVYQHNATMQL